MNGTMDIGIVVFVIVPDRIDDRLRLLGGGRIIEVGQRLAVHQLLQRRELSAHGHHVER